MLQRLRRSCAVALLTASSSIGALAVQAPPVHAAEPTAPEPLGWILVDAGTGKVLDGRDFHTPRHPASMAKVVTALTALDRLPSNSRISITPAAVAHGSQNRDASGMSAGETWSMNSSLGALLVLSANDAAYAIANEVAPDINDFGTIADATAKRMGMNESTFNDPAGLDDETSIGGGPMTSPYDMAIAVRNARNVPLISKWVGTATWSFTDPKGIKHNATNHNLMLPGLTKAYDGTDGFKTGFTNKAGGTLAATATRNGRTLIAVVMTTADTFGWAAKLFDRGFAMPLGSAQTQEVLPANNYQSLTQRTAQQQDFLALAQRPGSVALATDSSTTKPTKYEPSSTTPTTKATAATSAKAASSDSGGGGSTTTIVVIGFVAVLGAAFFARRAQVKRQRARRLAKRRAMQAALRRGSLPVVDGKYRAGMRTGPPVSSNVRVRKLDEDQ